MKKSPIKMMDESKNANRVELKGDLLKELQATRLAIMKDFAAICEKYSFYYSLSGGTALGAVRHGGFIPWDDDVDVFMHRKDIPAFYTAFDKELREKYYLQSMDRTPELGISIMRLMKRGTTYVVFDTLDNPERGVFIDIFVLENAPNNKVLRTLHGLGSLYYGLAMSCKRYYVKRSVYRDLFASADKRIKNAVEQRISIGRLLFWRSLANWTSKCAKWNALCKNGDSKYVVCPTGLKHYFGELFPREYYMNTMPIAFEDTEFRIIQNYDWALRKLYGDYMDIPSESNRTSHYVMEINL